MKENILIIGAGLSGTLLAIRLAQRGYQVELREKRGDMRLESIEAGRSINLALSNRGLKALDLAGVKEDILKLCIPMYGRMIHNMDGSLRFSKYSGRESDYINSVSRGGLNIVLLNKAESYDNLSLVFNSKCKNVDIDKNIATFINSDGEQENVVADIIFGSDGAGSALRQSYLSKTTDLLFNYSQDFLRTGYKELSMPPDDKGQWRIEKNALHIWPRQQFMMIALPNLDGSFTVTLFHPFEGEAGFNRMDSANKIENFFDKYYADSVEHMPELIEDYFDNPVGALGTIKCYPWQANGSSCLIGDAAHAVVPFYGQGMNASFEDVRVLDEILEANDNKWEQVLKEFQDSRVVNTNAIADLAIDNFYEMQDKVDDPEFIRKRKLEMQLEDQYPEYYSKYSLVTFKEDLPYSEAMRIGRLQDELLLEICSQETEPDPEKVLKQLKNIK